MEKSFIIWHLKLEKDEFTVGKRVWAQYDPDGNLYDVGHVSEIRDEGVVVLFAGWNKSRFFRYEDSPALIRDIDEEEEPEIQIVDLDED